MKLVYLTGIATRNGSAPTTGTWTFTFSSVTVPARPQLDLLYDYRTNVELYPQWQAFLSEHTPPTLILWGENDIIFAPAGARAYLRDLPKGGLHMLDSGHFTLEDSLKPIAAHIKRFHAEQVVGLGDREGSCGRGKRKVRVLSVNVGMPREVVWRGKPVTTAIYKQQVEGPGGDPLTLNLDGDRQADLRVHGGRDKAVYSYPSEFYELWSRERPELEFGPGKVGENLTTEGLLDGDVSVGDRFRVGTAELVVTQPRIPCFKLGIKMGRDEFVIEFLERGLLGFYLAVAREGEVAAGDPIVELQRDPRGFRGDRDRASLRRRPRQPRAHASCSRA